jgi:stage III sporulation protein AB
MLFIILVLSTLIGRYISKKYVFRLEELEEIKNSLNIIKSKIKFTYEPIPEIFEEISSNTSKNISNIFVLAKEKMSKKTASEAWEEAVENTETNLKNEDIRVVKTLSKLLGQTDVEGQISQIEITEQFLETQIKEAYEEKQKNEKLYTRLGTTIGLVIVIILC